MFGIKVKLVVYQKTVARVIYGAGTGGGKEISKGFARKIVKVLRGNLIMGVNLCVKTKLVSWRFLMVSNVILM